MGEMWQLGNGERDVKCAPVYVAIPGVRVVDLALGGVSAYAVTGTLVQWVSLPLMRPQRAAQHGSGAKGRMAVSA